MFVTSVPLRAMFFFVGLVASGLVPDLVIFSRPVFSFPGPVSSVPGPVFSFPGPVFSFPGPVSSGPGPVSSGPGPVCPVVLVLCAGAAGSL